MSIRVITRRTALGALGAAGVTLAFAPLGSRRRAPRGRVQINYWEKWTGHEGLAMRRLVDAFNESQDRIWVNMLSISTIDIKAQIAIAGGDPPDLCGLWSFALPAYQSADAIMPIDAFPDSHVREDLYAPATWRLLTMGGRQWAGVLTASSMALYYNKAHFRDAGIERPPRTIEELDEASRRLEVGSGASMSRAGFLHKEPGWWPGMWPYHFGASLFDEGASEAGEVTIDDPTALQSYEWMASYPERLGRASVMNFWSGFGNYGSPQMAFLTGKVSMLVQGPWLVNNIRAYRPDLEFGAAPFPVASSIYDPEAPKALAECDILVIPKGCPHPEEAWEFFKYTQTHAVQEALSGAHCKPSGLRTCSEAFLETHDNPYVRMHDELLKSPGVYIWPQVPSWLFMSEETVKLQDRIWDTPGSWRSHVEQASTRMRVEHARQVEALRQQRAARG